MTQYVMGADGIVQMLPDGAATDPISTSLQQSGIYQSPDGWAIVTAGPGQPLGGAPRIILDTNGKQPPPDVMARFPMATPQEQQGFQQQKAQYEAGEGKPVSFAQAVLTAAGSYFGGQALGNLAGGATAAAPATGAASTDAIAGYPGSYNIASEGFIPGSSTLNGSVMGGSAAAPEAAGTGLGIKEALSGAGLAATLASLNGGGSNTDMTGFTGNAPSFSAPGAATLGSGLLGTVAGTDGSYSGLPNVGANVGGSVYDLSGLNTPAATGNSSWDSVLNGTGGGVGGSQVLPSNLGNLLTPDVIKALGAAAPGVLGALSSARQTSQLSDLAKQQMAAEQARYADTVARDNARYATATQREDAAIGRQQSQIAADKAVVAPSQARYESTFQPGFTMANDPGYQDALDQSSKATLHALSVNGNPAGSPNAWAQSLTDNYQKTAYPALQAYRSTNANTGGYGSAGAGAATIPSLATNIPAGATAGSGVGYNAGSSTAAQAIGQSGTTFADLGGAVNNVVNPSPTIADLLKKLGTGNSGNIFAVQ